MCGIVGKLTWRTPAPVHERLVRTMADRLRHRGPDAEGFYTDQRVALGHRRLAVIDQSAAANQPMPNEDGTVLAILNGEIYNHPELRERLIARGHTFRSHTDTEVLVHLYEDEGLACIAQLRGMFAFALWDRPAQRLVVARDRLGKKPLHYALTPDGLTFASELKALVLDRSIDRRVDPVAVHHYLSYQYVPAPLTIFGGVRKLAPAHFLVAENGHVWTKRYWQLCYEPKLDLTEPEATEQFVALLREAVRARLVSDVPLGAFLSGGVDSSLVVALMAELGVSPLRTFSIGFGETAYNELPYARDVARRVGSEHHELRVGPESVARLPELVAHYDEPYADASALPTFLLSGLAREHVTVALSGDGGDEDFAGYQRYPQALQGGRLQSIPPGARQQLAHLVARTVPARDDGLLARGNRRFVRSTRSPLDHYFSLLSFDYFDDPVASLYTPAFAASILGVSSLGPLEVALGASDARTSLDSLLAMDVSTYLPDDLLVKVDIASMAHGLEVRSPLLDQQVAEFAARLPVDLKLRHGSAKRVLKAAARRYLPAAIVDRPKAGFAVPLDSWFRHELRCWPHDILLDSRALARGYFRPERIRRLVDQHASGKADHGARLWMLLAFELWHRQFVDTA